MRTVRFLTLGLFFLPALTLAIGCGGEVVSPDTNMTEAEDPALTDDSTMIEETGDGDALAE